MTEKETLDKLKEELEFILLSHKKILPVKEIRERSSRGMNLISTVSAFLNIPNKEREEIMNWFLGEIKKMEVNYEKSRFDENPKKYIIDVLQKDFLFSELQFNILFNNQIYLKYQGKEFIIKVEEKE